MRLDNLDWNINIQIAGVRRLQEPQESIFKPVWPRAHTDCATGADRIALGAGRDEGIILYPIIHPPLARPLRKEPVSLSKRAINDRLLYLFINARDPGVDQRIREKRLCVVYRKCDLGRRRRANRWHYRRSPRLLEKANGSLAFLRILHFSHKN